MYTLTSLKPSPNPVVKRQCPPLGGCAGALRRFSGGSPPSVSECFASLLRRCSCSKDTSFMPKPRRIPAKLTEPFSGISFGFRHSQASGRCSRDAWDSRCAPPPNPTCHQLPHSPRAAPRGDACSLKRQQQPGAPQGMGMGQQAMGMGQPAMGMGQHHMHPQQLQQAPQQQPRQGGAAGSGGGGAAGGGGGGGALGQGGAKKDRILQLVLELSALPTRENALLVLRSPPPPPPVPGSKAAPCARLTRRRHAQQEP